MVAQKREGQKYAAYEMSEIIVYYKHGSRNLVRCKSRLSIFLRHLFIPPGHRMT